MADLLGLIDLLLPFFGLIGIGALCGKLSRRPEVGLAWMQFFLVYVSLPCLFFHLIADKPLEQLANWRFLGSTTLCTFLAFVLSYAIGYWHSRDLPRAVVQGLGGCYANVGYMGPPLVLSALGGAASAPVALVFIGDVMLLFLLTPILMAVAGVEKRSLPNTLKAVVREVATHPFNVGIAAAIAASYFQVTLPKAIDTMIVWSSNAAAPCALFVLGVTVALRPAGRITGEVPILVLVKLVVHPLLVWLVLSFVGGFAPAWAYAGVLMAALPPAMTLFVVSSQYKVGQEQASACVLLGTSASLVTLSVLLWLIKSGRMPPSLFS
jgi:malonate transporter